MQLNCTKNLKPSSLLGFLLIFVIFFLLLFLGWEFCWSNTYLFFKYPPPKLNVANWLFLIGIVAAISGWIFTAWVTVRNSIKQHTINTLLQSRLSVVYMENANKFNKSFYDKDDKPVIITVEDLTNQDKKEALASARYLLNYFEFIAVGIKYGDLHSGLLKDSLRGILSNAHEICKDMIKHRQTTNPRVYANLEWLNKEWNK